MLKIYGLAILYSIVCTFGLVGIQVILGSFFSIVLGIAGLAIFILPPIRLYHS